MSWNTISPHYRDLAQQHLSEKQLRVLELRTNGHSWTQIAADLRVGESTVRGHHRAAIHKMRTLLRKDTAA